MHGTTELISHLMNMPLLDFILFSNLFSNIKGQITDVELFLAS